MKGVIKVTYNKKEKSFKLDIPVGELGAWPSGEMEKNNIPQEKQKDQVEIKMQDIEEIRSVKPKTMKIYQ